MIGRLAEHTTAHAFLGEPRALRACEFVGLMVGAEVTATAEWCGVEEWAAAFDGAHCATLRRALAAP